MNLLKNPENFRAWFKADIEEGFVLKFAPKLIEENDPHIFDYYFVMEGDKEIRYPFSILLFGDEDVIIEQYIGKTDKNETKIFEGDILLHSYEEHEAIDQTVEYLIAKYDEDRCCFVLDLNGCGYDLNEFNYQDLEICGNIYSHKVVDNQLLKLCKRHE